MSAWINRKKKKKEPPVLTYDQIYLEFQRLKSAGEHTYRQYKKTKSSGGYRVISVPSDSLKALQQELLRYLGTFGLEHKYATGFRNNKSVASNALAHSANFNKMDAFAKGQWQRHKVQGKSIITMSYDSVDTAKVRKMAPQSGIALDVTDAFGSVTPKLLGEALYEYENPFNLGGGAAARLFDQHEIDFFVEVCIHKGRLPQGAPTSPLMLNVAMKLFDEYVFATLVAKIGKPSNTLLKYTRFADDITITANKKSVAKRAESIVSRSLRRYGFRMNKKKTKIMSHKNGIFVTGINVVNSLTHVSTSRRYRDKIKCAIHQMSLKSKEDPDYREQYLSLIGRMGYVLSTDQIHGAKLLDLAISSGVIAKYTRFAGEDAQSIVERGNLNRVSRTLAFSR